MGEQPAGEPYVHASGAGPPAVLVHGTFVGGPESFGAQAPLADRYRLLVVDRRGYGANPGVGETLGWPVDSEDLPRLLESVGGPPGGSFLRWCGGRGRGQPPPRPGALPGAGRAGPARGGRRPSGRGGDAGTGTGGVRAGAGHVGQGLVAALADQGRRPPGGEWAMAEVVRRVGVEVVVLEGSGHLPPIEEPERFNDLLRTTWAVPGSGGKW